MQIQELGSHRRVVDHNENWIVETGYHPKLADRYPKGTSVRKRRDAQGALYREIALTAGDSHVLFHYPMQPYPHLLDRIDHPFDVVAPTLLLPSGQGLTLIEDHVHAKDYGFSMGKSTIVHSLLGFPTLSAQVQVHTGLVVGEKVPAKELAERVNAAPDIPVVSSVDNGVKFLSGDITFVGKSPHGRLVAMPMVATQEDITWDFARRAVRTSVSDYDRSNPNVRNAQMALMHRLRVDTDAIPPLERAYPISEVVVLRPNPDLQQPAQWDNTPTDPEDLHRQLHANPTYLAPQTTFWEIDEEKHKRKVDALMQGGLHDAPRVSYLEIQDPRVTANLRAAEDLIRRRFFAPSPIEIWRH